MGPARSPFVSVIVPFRNAAATLTACSPTLLKAAPLSCGRISGSIRHRVLCI